MLSLNSQPDKNKTPPTEKLLGLKLKTTLSSLTPSTQNVTNQNPTVIQNLRHKLPEITRRTIVRIGSDKQNLWNIKKELLWVKTIAHDHTIFWTKEEMY